MSARSRRPSPDASDAEGVERGRPGRVVAHHGIAVRVRLESGEEHSVALAHDQRVVVGDRVRWTGSRLEVEPARGVLRRRDGRGRERTIATNLDVLGIVVAPEPREPPGYVDRGIVIARSEEIEPQLVMNKLDLEGGAALADTLQAIYGSSVSVHRVSATEGTGLEGLRAALAGGRLGALVGPSGVGKSSLLNALVPGLELTVGVLDARTGRGRHTTATATLHLVEGGGLLVDTAGFRDFLAVDLEPGDAARHFPGFERALVDGCRFRNCLHREEPGCGVLGALARGEIEPRRHRAYVALLDELSGSSSTDSTPGRRRRGRV